MSEIKVNSVVNSTGDNDSGLDLSTNDQVIIKTANTTAVTVDSSQGVTVAGAFTSRGIDDNADSTAITIDSSERVMIGTTTEGEVSADDLTIATSGNTGITIRSGTASNGAIYFSDGTSGDDEYRGILDYDHNDNKFRIFTNASERFRIDNSGKVLIGTTGSMNLGFGAQKLSVLTTDGTSPAIFGTTSASTSTSIIYNSSSSTAVSMCDWRVERSASDQYNFVIMRSDNNNDNEFIFVGNGNALADGSFSGGGADYAEYFEWKDGNTDKEDRRGYTVVLDGDKIRKSTSDDNASTIIGVVSGNPSMVGDSDINQWKHKYQRDNYGTYIVDKNGDRVLNSSYDDTKEYISREDRQEWNTIGLMGKLRVRVGQTIGDRWIKMREISDTVHEYLVR